MEKACEDIRSENVAPSALAMAVLQFRLLLCQSQEA